MHEGRMSLYHSHIIWLTCIEERLKLINRLKRRKDKGLKKLLFVCLEWSINHIKLQKLKGERAQQIIAKKVCWVVCFLFSLLNKTVEFQISLTVAEGNVHSGLNMLLQILLAHSHLSD